MPTFISKRTLIMNKLFLKLNRTSYIIQFLCILIVVVLFVSSKPSYVSSVTINPVLDQSTLVTETAIKLTSTYTPSYSAALYLIELADEASRKETFRKFLSENKLACVGAPKIQFYAKADNSFPVTGHFTVITVKSSCIDFVEKFVTFLSNDIDKKLIDKIINANGGLDNFSKGSEPGWFYPHACEAFTVGYLIEHKVVRLNRN